MNPLGGGVRSRASLPGLRGLVRRVGSATGPRGRAWGRGGAGAGDREDGVGDHEEMGPGRCLGDREGGGRFQGPRGGLGGLLGDRTLEGAAALNNDIIAG